MMQSGLSRELFESWCTDPKNGVIVAGYCVEGTLAKTILSEPEEITTMNGQKLPLNMSVDYISFSAHTDYQQTSEFIRLLKPNHVVLVHGEANEMSRLKSALQREYESKPNANIQFYNPRNTHAVELYFKGEKTAKVMGSLAAKKVENGDKVSGILVKRDFKYHVLAASDLSKYTDMSMSTVTQRQSLQFSGSPGSLKTLLESIGGIGSVEVLDNNKKFRAFDHVEITFDGKVVILEWKANPVSDMFSDTILASLMQVELHSSKIKGITKNTKSEQAHRVDCILETLQDMFGESAIPKTIKDNVVNLTVNEKNVTIDLNSMDVVCEEDEVLRDMVNTAVGKLNQVVY
jgi:cleavage and polyadenylation specificity factor subunit 3